MSEGLPPAVAYLRDSLQTETCTSAVFSLSFFPFFFPSPSPSFFSSSFCFLLLHVSSSLESGGEKIAEEQDERNAELENYEEIEREVCLIVFPRSSFFRFLFSPTFFPSSDFFRFARDFFFLSFLLLRGRRSGFLAVWSNRDGAGKSRLVRTELRMDCSSSKLHLSLSLFLFFSFSRRHSHHRSLSSSSSSLHRSL